MVYLISIETLGNEIYTRVKNFVIARTTHFLSINSLTYKLWLIASLYSYYTGVQEANGPVVDSEPNLREKYSVSDL